VPPGAAAHRARLPRAGLGRGDRIRTCGLLLPKQARYQAALRPEFHGPGGASRDRTGGLIVANDALSRLSYGPSTVGRDPPEAVSDALAPAEGIEPPYLGPQPSALPLSYAGPSTPPGPGGPGGEFLGRGDRIRTYDPLVPNQMRYQAALHPDIGNPAFVGSPKLWKRWRGDMPRALARSVLGAGKGTRTPMPEGTGT
jgi:hypothetical protein